MNEKYAEVFHQMEETFAKRIKEERYPAMGYTSNLSRSFSVDLPT